MKKDKKTTTKNPDITEIKLAEEKARQAAAEWQTTFDSIADMVSIQSKDFKLVRVNKAYADAVGMKIDEIIGKHCYEVVHNTSSSIVNCPHRQTLETKKAVTQEVFEPRLNAYLEVSTSPIFDSDGEILGSVHIAKNITERKKAETALRERLKELNCLYSISAILEVPGISLNEILKRIVLVLPPAWRFPDITEACIMLRGQTFQTDHFRETSWMQFSQIIVHGKPEGQIRVCYLEERRSSDDKPFLIEERRLLDAIAERLGRVIERVWAEEALQQSEERYRSLYVESRDAVMILSPDEGFLAGNPSAIEMFRCRDEQDFTSRTPASLSPKFQTDGALSAAKSHEMMRIALEKGSHSFEWVHRRADGTDFNATVLLSRMEIGGKRLLQATVRDITENKRAAERLAHLSLQNELILSSAAEGILGLDLQGNHTFINPAAARMLGYEVEELIVRHSHNTWHHTKADGNPYPKEECNIYAAYRDGVVHRASNEVFWRKDGTSFPVEYASTPIYERGRLAGAVVSFADITERKQAEMALRQFVDRLSLATRAGGVGIWDYDIINNKLIWDDQMYHLYGITQDKFGGAYEAWRAGLHPEDMQRGDDEIQMALRGEKEFDTEFRVLWPDGTIRNIRALAILQRDASGKPLRMIGTNWDITERKQAEAELEKTIQELQSAIEQIKTLKGLVPICAWCKKIRNDKGYWEQVEAYVSRYTEAQFSHGICPECAKKAYPEFSKDEKTDSR